MKNILIGIIRAYQLTLSPMLTALVGHGCRFRPTCSHYAISAIQKFGVAKGSQLALKRIGKCHPFHQADSFFDPLPKKA